MNLIIFGLSPGQLALCLTPALINLWAIWHAATHKFASQLEQTAWIMVCTFVPVLGGLAYMCFGLRRNR